MIYIYINAREASFLRKASATSIGAGLWPLGFGLEKDSHAQPPLAAMTVFPSLALPSGKRLAFGVGRFFMLGSA